MNVVGSLIAYGLRQVIGDSADQVVDYAGQAVPYVAPVIAAIKKRLTDHGQALPNALAKANDRAWQAVGLALAGDGLFDRVKDLFRDGDLKGVRDQIKKFLAQAPTGLESATAGVRLKAAEEWQRLRKGKRLSADSIPFDELARRAASMERYSDPARLTAAAHLAVADTAAALKEEAPHLAALLTVAPPDGAPLLAAAFAFFFRREVETNPELAHGLSFDLLRRISERQERGFEQLEVSLGAHTGRVLDRLDGLFDALGDWFAAADAKLGDIKAMLEQLARQRDVPISPSPPVDKAKPGHVVAVPIKGAEMKFAWCPPGMFLMGGNGVGDNPQHRVTISKRFWMGVYPVTQAQWQAVMGYNPSRFPREERPVEMVSWDDGQDFCERMAQLTGKPIRLPTEAEWEYACRAGTTDEYFSGNGEDALKKVGWYDGNSGKQTHVVEEKKVANPWSLFDIHGNVWEWCQDWYGTLGSYDIIDPISPNSGDARVLRGGSWGNYAEDCRAAYRSRLAPRSRYFIYGLRVCFHLD